MADQTAIKVTGRIEEADYVRAQWLHLRPRPIMAVFGVLFVAMLIVGGAFQIMGWVQGENPASDALMLPFLASVLLLYFAFLSWRFRRSYRNYKAIKVPIDIEISETELHGKSVHGEARLPWDLFRKFKENKHLFLLYQSDGLFHMLPKRLFSGEADVQRARDIFLRQVKSAT